MRPAWWSLVASVVLLAGVALAGATGQGLVGGGNCASSSAGCKAASFSTSGGANIGGGVDAGWLIVQDVAHFDAGFTIGQGSLGWCYYANGGIYCGPFTVATGQTSFNGAGITTTASLHINGGASYIDTQTAGFPLVINDAEGLRITPQILPTCTGALIGIELPDIYSGDGGVRTKKCFCTSNGVDGGATMAWQNMATGTIGNTTNCGTE